MIYSDLQAACRKIIADDPTKRDDIWDILQTCNDDREDMSDHDAVRLAITAIRDQYGDVFTKHYFP